MKAKDFLVMLNGASENAEIKVENGEIVITEPKPIEYKFNVGDKVIYPRLADASEIMTITERLSVNGYPCYRIATDKNITLQCLEEDIHPYVPQDITECIKTFEDACGWCESNDKDNLVLANALIHGYLNDMADMQDVFAYLKLRIITSALNEGWEPTFAEDELRCYCICDTDGDVLQAVFATKLGNATPWPLYFKSRELAEYAATQFRDIYADFCGIKKGGEE